MWLVGGGPYYAPTNEVWYTADGDSWDQEDPADWSPRTFLSAVIHDGKMWVMAGDTSAGSYTGTSDVWYTAGPSGVEETLQVRPGLPSSPTVACGVLHLPACADAVLLDASGRKVADLVPGPNDIRHVGPGIYFVRAVGRGPSAVGCQKVIVTR